MLRYRHSPIRHGGGRKRVGFGRGRRETGEGKVVGLAGGHDETILE